MRILIAEHDPAVASLVKKGLEAEHYAVDVAADEHQAYDLGAKVDYDLAVLDLDLPAGEESPCCAICAPAGLPCPCWC
jgi:DNA-binding response OmpR family regulator